jgi:hypothetical protein
MKLLIIQPPPASRYFLLLRSKYTPHHPVLIHPQSTLLPQCDRPTFTTIQSNR